MSPLVSVLIPCFRAQSFLPDALVSLERQHYRPIEVVIISDDGCDYSAFTQYVQGLRVIHCSTGRIGSGAPNAKNVGLLHASGAVIAKLDADDILLPDYLARTVPVALRYGACLTGRQPVDFASLGSIETRNPSRYSELSSGLLSMDDYVHMTFNWDALYRRDLLALLKWPDQFEEDLYFEAAVFERVGFVPFEKAQSYLYRMRQGSICNREETLREVQQSYTMMMQQLDTQPEIYALGKATAKLLCAELKQRLSNIAAYLYDRKSGLVPEYSVLVEATQYQRPGGLQLALA